MRIYKTAPGFLTITPSLHRSPGGWYLAWWRWVITTENE